jgi:hypothetical protein
MSGFVLIIQPDAEEPEAAEVLVDGSVGGRPYRFLLDTGAAKSAILSDDYTATFAAVERHTSSGVFASGSADVILAPDIELGPIARRDFPMTRLADNTPHRRNLIGMDLLKDFRCHFLFDANRVEIDGDTFDASYHDLALDSRFHPYVPLRFGAVAASAVWDTGAGITVADMGFIARHSSLFQAAGQSEGTDSTGTSVATLMFTMTGAVIGDLALPPLRVAGVDLAGVNATIETPMDVIIGYNLMRAANWLMDFPRRRWAITKRLA